jgi:predicted DNA-binding antitoxin AbrB/MazE fold protein
VERRQATKVATFEGIVENGRIRLPAEVDLPEKTKVYVVIPGFETTSAAYIGSPRLVHEDGVFKPLKKPRKLKEGAIGKVQVDDVHVEATRKRPSVRSSEFFGLWKNRKDMDDELSYVRNLRSKSRC